MLLSRKRIHPSLCHTRENVHLSYTINKKEESLSFPSPHSLLEKDEYGKVVFLL